MGASMLVPRYDSVIESPSSSRSGASPARAPAAALACLAIHACAAYHRCSCDAVRTEKRVRGEGSAASSWQGTRPIGAGHGAGP
jgi:hypothetical protein